MLDLNFVRDNLPLVEEKLRQRGMRPAEVLKDFGQVDAQRRQAITSAETMKAQRNRATEEIAKVKKSGGDASALIAETKELREQVEELGKAAEEYEERLQQILVGIPNMPHASVPVGKTRGRQHGSPPLGHAAGFDFTPKPHWEMGEQLGVLDLERAAKISGARFAVYWDTGRAPGAGSGQLHARPAHSRAWLHRSVAALHGELRFHVRDRAICPSLQRIFFKVPHGDKDLWLIPTAEVPVTNLYRDEVLEAARLPVSLTAYTPCFRSEAGSYGKDVRGIIRQHQFQKVEMVKFARPEDSYEQLEKLTHDAEEVLQKLGLHYRVVALSTGDMGFSSAKTYDIEVWLPGQQLFREISSCSNFESFQARRANIRFRPEGKNKTEFVHTLNGSGLAVGRTWVAIVENYQQADGSVVIPEALRPYMGTDRLTPRKM